MTLSITASVVMLSVRNTPFMVSVIMLNVVTLNIVAMFVQTNIFTSA
jgi:hypothetical protein